MLLTPQSTDRLRLLTRRDGPRAVDTVLTKVIGGSGYQLRFESADESSYLGFEKPVRRRSGGRVSLCEDRKAKREELKQASYAVKVKRGMVKSIGIQTWRKGEGKHPKKEATARPR